MAVASGVLIGPGPVISLPQTLQLFLISLEVKAKVLNSGLQAHTRSAPPPSDLSASSLLTSLQWAPCCSWEHPKYISALGPLLCFLLLGYSSSRSWHVFLLHLLQMFKSQLFSATFPDYLT